MSKDIKVLFWKDTEWIVSVREGVMPTKEDIEKDYVQIPIEIHRNNLDSIYAMLNGPRNPMLEPRMQRWIDDNMTHTSMSVGDIVKLGGNDLYIAANLGWKKL